MEVKALNREIEALDKQNRQLKDQIGTLGYLAMGYVQGLIKIVQLGDRFLGSPARSNMEDFTLQEQLANQQEIEADSVNLCLRERERWPNCAL